MIMKIKKICQYCGKEYYVSKSQEYRSKFCSDNCFRKSRNTQVECHCEYCGKLFKVKKCKYDAILNNPNRHLYCSAQCAKDVQKPKWEDIVSLFNEKGYVLLSTEYVNAKTKLEYICPQHKDKGSQFIRYNNLKHGFGCKYCGQDRTAESRRLSFDEAKAIFDKHDMILLDQEYVNTSIPMEYICKHHPEVGVQYMATSNAYKQYCPYCNIVKGEVKILNYLLQQNIEYEKPKSYDGLYGIGGGKLSYDFYLPKFNLLIEYQGTQHEKPVEHFGGEEQFLKQQEHDKRKREYALNNNIQLLEIWYYDFSNIEDILNENILQIT